MKGSVLVSFTSLFLAVTAGRALAQATTCDEDERLCCSSWIAPVTLDGKVSFNLSADSHGELASKIKHRERMNRALCKFWGSQDSSCRERTEAPRCRPAVAPRAPANAAEALIDDVITAARKEIERKIGQNVDIENDFGALGKAIAPFLPVEHEGKNPFEHAGETLKDYARALELARDELRRLQEIFRSIVEPQVEQVANDITKLWEDNGSFADSGAASRRRFDVGDKVSMTLDGVPKPPAPPPPRVTIDRDYTVTRAPQAPATIVAVGTHAMKRGFKLVRGDYPLGAASITKTGIFMIPVSAVKQGDKLLLTVRDRGTVELAMIPDEDGDGVLDAKDRCKSIPGPQAMKGCPDGDGDGVIDPNDRCPTLVGISPTGCPKAQPCNANQHNGTNAPETHVVAVGKGSGQTRLAWSMLSIPDRIEVWYEGRKLFDTYCVSNQGSTWIDFHGHSGLMEVKVYPNCDYNSKQTSWSYSLGCAQ